MGKPKVLVVDDDAFVRRTVVRLVASFCEVQEAPGGAEALDLLRSGYRPDLVLSDVDMPIVDGPSFFRNALEEGLLPRDAFIFMSGSQTGEKIFSLIREKLIVIRKPFDPSFFLSAVEVRLSDLALTRLRRMAKVVA